MSLENNNVQHTGGGFRVDSVVSVSNRFAFRPDGPWGGPCSYSVVSRLLYNYIRASMYVYRVWKCCPAFDRRSCKCMGFLGFVFVAVVCLLLFCLLRFGILSSAVGHVTRARARAHKHTHTHTHTRTHTHARTHAH